MSLEIETLLPVDLCLAQWIRAQFLWGTNNLQEGSMTSLLPTQLPIY
jgi:hypothetical protein